MSFETEIGFKKTIERTYQEFEQDFTEVNFPSIFDWIKQFNEAGRFGKNGHPLLLSPHPIFQTVVRKEPRLMLIGNNNSWFDSNDHNRAKKNLLELANRVPDVNSYLDHHSTFGQSLRKIFGPDRGGFEGLNKLGLLRNCVGINRLWIQVGADDKPTGVTRGMKSASEDLSPTLKESFKGYCESRTRKLVELIQPEILVLVGKNAKVLYEYHEEPTDVTVVYPSHPAYGREREFAHKLRAVI